MKETDKQMMFDYYSERVSEYDNIYTGKGPASISDSNAYISEAKAVGDIINSYAGIAIADIGCGTGYWIPCYCKKARSIDLYDQSLEMLESAHKKVKFLSINAKVTKYQADVLFYDLGLKKYDFALAGFLLSHFTPEEEKLFVKKLKNAMVANGKIVIVDSVWNQERALKRNKSGSQKRMLNDGREFEIFKKYYTAKEFKMLAESLGSDAKVEHFGKVFCAAVINCD